MKSKKYTDERDCAECKKRTKHEVYTKSGGVTEESYMCLACGSASWHHHSRENNDSISLGLKKIRLRRLYNNLLLLGFIPFILLSSKIVLTFTLENKQSENILLFVGGFYMLVIGISTIRSIYTKCPSCNNLYSLNKQLCCGGKRGHKRCLHCGLKLN